MVKDPTGEIDSTLDSDEELLSEFGDLWDEAEELWDLDQDALAFERYVSADFLDVARSLVKLRGQALVFLEWGSGLGVTTIMASRLGFEAYGIEADGTLVEHSERLAEAYGPNARFAQGSFIPDEFEWRPSDDDEVNRTVIDIPAGYAELDMELRDFDLIYAYPWPNEHTLYHSIIRQFARPDVLFLSYDAREGTEVVTFGRD